MSNTPDNTSVSVSAPHFTENLLAILTETFENTRGIYLDKGADFFSTLAALSAAEASRNVFSTTIAAQTFHTAFYLQALERYLEGFTGKTDWNESWTTQTVTESAWDALRAQLREDNERVTQRLRAVTDWDEDALDFGLPIVVHSAYHLGAIRQLVKAVKETP